jgi:acyl-CoA reductase-like NAD-dependent aldehyde dehydrogenase
VSSLEAIVEELKSLPPAELALAAGYIRRLKRLSPEEREEVLRRTAGALSKEEAEELERIIEEGCERVDERDW